MQYNFLVTLQNCSYFKGSQPCAEALYKYEPTEKE